MPAPTLNELRDELERWQSVVATQRAYVHRTDRALLRASRDWEDAEEMVERLTGLIRRAEHAPPESS